MRLACDLRRSTAYTVFLRPCRVGHRHEAPSARIGKALGGEAPWGYGRDVVLEDASARPVTGVKGGMQQAIGEAPQSAALADATLRRPAPSTTLAAPRGLLARPEPDSDMVGSYMRDAIERGGYRAALEYYGSDEAKESDTPWHRLRLRGWLLGRLGLYDQLDSWLEEATALPDFVHLLDARASVQRAAYSTPALWLEEPKPVPRSADHIMTVEPAAAPDPDIRAVPDHVWTAMLILDAAGPICSHAGLGAAAFLVGAGAGRKVRGRACGPGRYDPLRGARLHGAPEGCHRWIIADMDFEPWLIEAPHYYYDLTDEGRGTLEAARAAGAPWPKAVEAAASGLEGMSLSDLLESACGLGGPRSDLGRVRGGLARLLDAWDCQEKGTETAPVSAEDRALVDLGTIARRPHSGGGTGPEADRLLCLMAVVESTHKIACEAESPSDAEMSVLEALIGALRDQCRRHADAVVAAASRAIPRTAAASGAHTWRAASTPRRPLYSDAAPALICDLYYCLGEYCESRSLASDPRRLPLSERLTGEEKAAMMEAFAKDNPLYADTADSRSGGRCGCTLAGVPRHMRASMPMP